MRPNWPADGWPSGDSIRAFPPFDGRYKLAINLLTSDELYDLRDDPFEMENLIDRATWSYTGMTRQLDSEPGRPRLLDYETGLEIEQTTRSK